MLRIGQTNIYLLHLAYASSISQHVGFTQLRDPHVVKNVYVDLTKHLT